MVAFVGFEIEKLKTNKFPHLEDQMNTNYLGISIVYLEDHSIVLGNQLRVEEV